jgi:hypothetical protein
MGWTFALLAGGTLVGLSVHAPAAVAQSSGAGEWNDARSRALVEMATRRRAEQLADTGLADYRAQARGYLTFLAQLGDGFLSPPKLVKTDQLALEVYWRAPNFSKQRIIGRRDTLLLPTDIQYHRDHLGIIQNNFPDFIRLGDGDEVRDVPHPLSAAGLALYDFRLSDSITIRTPGRDIHLLEVKVRPRDDRDARVVGAVYLDPTEGQVVRMAFNFTRAAFKDEQLEDLAIVLENRLVGARYWLPSRQEIEIRRTGTWMDYPVRGIIRGRWEIEQYQFNTALSPQLFLGPEIVTAPPQELRRFVWQGSIMDSLPPDVRATMDPDIQRVQAEARLLVRAQALARVQRIRFSARRSSDFVRANRVEGFAFGAGFNTAASNLSLTARTRYGIEDLQFKNFVQVRWERPTGSRFDLFGSRDLADIGEDEERSSVFNSLASQEFGSDLTDPYILAAAGGRLTMRLGSFDMGMSVAAERHRQARVHGRPVEGSYDKVPQISPLEGLRIRFSGERPLLDVGELGQLAVRARMSILRIAERDGFDSGISPNGQIVLKGTLGLDHRSTVGGVTLLITERAALMGGDEPLPLQELAYFGGPVSLPGYDLHSIAGPFASATRVELQLPVPFVAVPLGRFGRVPGRAHLAPYAAVAIVGGTVACTETIGRCPAQTKGAFPSVGVGLLTFYDLLRFDVGRGLKNGRWIFNVDVNREFWSIL